jgi:hypothetical protein
MRRMWALCVTLVLVAGGGAGCSHRSAPDQGEIKEAFIRQLVGMCAEVDRQLAHVDKTTQPGMWADQFAGFVADARSQPPPDADRAQFDAMLTDMDGSVRQFRAAQTALAAGDQAASKEAIAQAKGQLGRADAAAQKYGMPPLNTCPDHDSTSSSPAPSPSTPPPAAAWLPRHASLAAIQQVDAAVLDGQIWVAGGLTSSIKGTAATQTYDPATDAWLPGAALPDAVDHAMLVTYQDRLVLIGGFISRDGDSVASSQVLFFDNGIGHWVKGPSLRHPRAAGAATVVGNKIVVVGGRTGQPEQLVPQTEIYDGEAWHDGAKIPVPGDHLAAASDHNYLYAVGGRKFVTSGNTDAVQRYDPATDRWTRMPALPERISGAGVAIIGGQLIVVSGETTTPSVSTAVRAFDLTRSDASWTTLPPLSQGRHGLAVAAIGNTLYAIGGSTRPGHTASSNTVNALTFS